MMIQPVSPAMKVMFEMSYPRACQMPGATSNSPWMPLSWACRHRLGCTVSGFVLPGSMNA